MLNLKKLLTKMLNKAVMSDSTLKLVASEGKTGTTLGSGAINLTNLFGVSASSSVPLSIYATNGAHTNGITANLLVLGNNYWAVLKDTATGNNVASESVALYLTYIKSVGGGTA